MPLRAAAVKPVPSIRGRLLRTHLVWSLLWGLALAVAVWTAVQHEVDELMDDTLQSAADGLIGPLVQPLLAQAGGAGAAGAAVLAQRPLPPVLRHGGPRFVWQVVGRGPGAPVVALATGAPAQALRGTPSPGFGDVPGWRVYGLALGTGGHMLYVAQSHDERTEAKIEVGLMALLAGLPLALLALLWLNARVRHELQPLQALSARLGSHDPLQPGSTLGAAARDELGPVHGAIDALAARLAHRVAHERAFAAHAAHALRTPLAGIDAQLAVALREAPPDLQPRLQRVRDAAARLQRVVVALLAMFRSGAEVQRQPLELGALAARLPWPGLTLHVQPGPPLSADADLLTAALLNLLDNAQQHGAHTVTLATPEPGVLTVHDDGRGLEAARRSALQQALDAQDYAGRTGLGLMLADLVARAHGGALTLPVCSAGFTARLDLRRDGAGHGP